MLKIGAHVGQNDPVSEAAARQADLVQFFLGDPQDFKNVPTVPGGDAAELKKRAQKDKVDLYVHAPYVINVATTNNRLRIPGRKMLAEQAEVAAACGAKALIVHGGHMPKGDEPEIGYQNWRKTFERWTPPLPVLIEKDRKSTRLNSSHPSISYAVFCLKKKKKKQQ